MGRPLLIGELVLSLEMIALEWFCACQMSCAFASQRCGSETWVSLECCVAEICVLI